MEEEVHRLLDYLSEKYRSLVNVMYHFIVDVGRVIPSVNEWFANVLKPSEYINLVDEVVKSLPGKLSVISGKTPMIRLYSDICDLNIISGELKGCSIYAYWIRPTHKRYKRFVASFKIPIQLNIFEKAVLTNVRDGIENSDVSIDEKEGRLTYSFNQPMFLLLLLYKYTNINQLIDFKGILKRYGIYDLIDELSGLEYRVEYPIYNNGFELFGDLLNKNISNDYNCEGILSDVVSEALSSIAGKSKVSLFISDFPSKDLCVTIVGDTIIQPVSGHVICFGKVRRLTIGDLLKVVDESVFAISYYAAVLQKLLRWLG